MNNSAVWNLLNPIRTGGVSVLTSGQEMFGTVIKHGINKKTIKVVFFSSFLNLKHHISLKKGSSALPFLEPHVPQIFFKKRELSGS